MIEKNIKVEDKKSQFSVPVVVGKIYFAADYDTGASETVITIDTFLDSFSEEKRDKVKKYFENKGIKDKTFKSASGDNITGYPVCAKNVIIGGVNFPTFNYYMILDSKRSVALIGYDFIDNCKFSHGFHDDIIIEDFDYESYKSKSVPQSVLEEDVLTFIDSLDGA